MNCPVCGWKLEESEQLGIWCLNPDCKVMDGYKRYSGKEKLVVKKRKKPAKKKMKSSKRSSSSKGMIYDFDVHYGSVKEEEFDWRKARAGKDDEPDDDVSRPASKYVIAMLGFDPDEEFTPEEGGRKKKR